MNTHLDITITATTINNTQQIVYIGRLHFLD